VFCRYSLRTTDLPAARAFYATTIGLQLPDGAADGSALEAWPLHERALAAGAPPHWLGQLAVDDVDAALSRLVSLGAQPLAPKMQGRDGTPFATVRDPFGAVIGVRGRGRDVSDAPIAWHQLHTQDADGAWALYHDLFGWAQKGRLDVPEMVGGLRLFAWNERSEAVGAIGNSARSPGVHTHWLFFLPVADLDRATESVRAHGGTAMTPFVMPSGMRVAGCEDPQGAAFGLAQRA
jgi:predicted enzyme related to lactoylglutathione lyase